MIDLNKYLYGMEYHSDVLNVTITKNENDLSKIAVYLKEFTDHFSIPYVQTYGAVSYIGNNALDLIGKLSSINNSHMFCQMENELGRSNHYFSFEVAKTRDDAVIPSKTHASDSGYDITILEPCKTIGDMTLYETGIKVRPSFGWYFDLVARSSIIKTGYVVANSVGVIDSQYRDTIKVPLLKIDKNAKELELPMRIAQIIPRQRVHSRPIIVDEKNFDNTSRGLGGFGSTG